MHHSFTWGEAAALLRVSGRTVIHAARVLSERQSRRSGGAAGGGAGTDHGQRCAEGHGRAGRGPAPGSGTGDRGWVQEPHRRGKAGPGRDLPAGGRGGARVQPGQAHGRNDNPPPLVGRPAWTARPGVGGGVRLPVRRPAGQLSPAGGRWCAIRSFSTDGPPNSGPSLSTTTSTTRPGIGI